MGYDGIKTSVYLATYEMILSYAAICYVMLLNEIKKTLSKVRIT